MSTAELTEEIPGEVLVGVIADTHGLLRPAVLEALLGCDHILHAGDIGKAEVIDALETLAPVTAIRGNVDRGPWADRFPPTAHARLGGQHVYVLHDLKTLDFDVTAANVDIVVSGHSHQPRVERNEGVLYLNPGSAGPRRFRLPISVALLRIGASEARAELVELAGRVLGGSLDGAGGGG